MKKVSALFAVLLMLFSCGGKKDTTTATSTRQAEGGISYGGIFKLNEVENFRHLYPHNVTDVVSLNVVSQVYEGLVKFDQGSLGDVVPALAEKWEVNDDATKFTFYLRNNVKFQDDPCFADGKGRSFGADDVLYCFTRLCEYNADNQMFWLFKDRVKGASAYYESTKNGSPLAEGVTGIRKIDEYTVEIELDAPFSGFLKLLGTAGGFIFPKEAVEKYGVEMRVKAVGTGPFLLERVSEGESVLLERNPNYWDVDEYGNQLPYLDAVKISFYSEKKTELMKFRSNDLHMVYKLPVEYIDEVLTSLDSAKQGGNLDIDVQSSSSMSVNYYGFLHPKGAFSDVRVRKAFNMAIDREELVTYILRGEGIPAEKGFVPVNVFGSYPYSDINGYTFDPDEAARLLAEAGYPGGKGITNMTLQLNSGGTTNEKVAVALQKMFEENLGVTLELDVMPLNQHYERVETGQAEFWRAGWLADYPDPENFLYVFHGKHTPENLSDRAYLNPFRYKSARFDSLYDAAMVEPQEAARMQLMAQADQTLMDDAVVLPLYYEEIIRLVNKQVKNFPINAMEYRDFTRVWLEPIEEQEEL